MGIVGWQIVVFTTMAFSWRLRWFAYAGWWVWSIVVIYATWLTVLQISTATIGLAASYAFVPLSAGLAGVWWGLGGGVHEWWSGDLDRNALVRGCFHADVTIYGVMVLPWRFLELLITGVDEDPDERARSEYAFRGHGWKFTASLVALFAAAVGLVLILA